MDVELFPTAQAVQEARLRGSGCLVLDVRIGPSSKCWRTEAALPIAVKAMDAGAAEFLTSRSATGPAGCDPQGDRAGSRHQPRAARARRASGPICVSAPHERDVRAGIVAGLLNKQIAAELGTSVARRQGTARARHAQDTGRVGGRA